MVVYDFYFLEDHTHRCKRRRNVQPLKQRLIMILGFTQKWPIEMGLWGHQPTNFVERIWKSQTPDSLPQSKFRPAIDPTVLDTEEWGLIHPKLHTIRKDSADRWKEGNDIHFYINVRKRDQFKFAPIVKVKSVQKIEIKHSGEKWRMPWVFIDGNMLISPEIKRLALNDGFDSVEQFFAWFKEDFEGKIIHWTDLTY